jgi:predicted ATPase
MRPPVTTVEQNNHVAAAAYLMKRWPLSVAGAVDLFETCVVGPQRGRSGNEGLPEDVVIRTPDRRLRVFVSSTLRELATERRAIARAISALRLTPVMFEVGARPHPPQDVYRAYLAQSDVFIGLYWQQYGWVGPGMEVSGLEDEFDLSQALPRLLYVKAPAPDREPRLIELLARIEAEASVSYRAFRTPEELGRLARDDLAMLLSERFAAARLSATAAAPPRPHRPRPLPVDATSLVGRRQAIDEVAELAGRPDVRLVTLTGAGGIGKTRLAVAVAGRLGDRFGARIAFVPLAAVTRPELVLTSVARAAGADLAGTGAPLEALAEYFGDDRWLLVLDNLEQVADAARDLDELLARCPGVAILATSRMVLGLRAEREYPVLPLPLPADPAGEPLEALASPPAVALFVDRARAVRYDFALTEGNAAAVAEICRRLEGLPLAIELAAAGTRLLDPDALLRRLSRSLDALGKGAVDLPERQRTLRATVDWSVELLEDAERSLLETVAVFVDGWTIDAAAQVADLGEDQALERSEALARHSLVYLERTEFGPRSRMLETVREFVAERLAARPDVAEVERRHAGYYRALAEHTDRPLRGTEQSRWADRLQAEAGNLAAAVRWYLAHDTGPLPHLFRVLWLFWFLRDHQGEARPWVSQLLPAAGSLDPQARAELLWTAAVIANEVGDDLAALAASERLAPLLDGIKDPYLHAVSQLVMASILGIAGDFGGALRGTLASLDQLRRQDEPFWTALADYTAGFTEMTIGRYDDALGHLSEMRDLGEQSGNAWLTAASRVMLGTLAVAQGRPQEARPLLDEGLDLSLAARSTQNVTLCLGAFARLAFAEGDPERAALLAGAADGLRRRVGLQAWPLVRRGEAELITQVRQALGADRFDEMFAAGARLNRRQARATARDRRDAGTATS